MKNRVIYDILVSIKKDNDVLDLCKKGYTYSQIAVFINELVDIGLMIYDEDGKIKVTEEGNNKFEEFKYEYDSELVWLKNRIKYWKKPVNKFDFYE